MCECVGREKVNLLENKWKMCFDEMDGISVWGAKRCAWPGVVEQDWEKSILS